MWADARRRGPPLVELLLAAVVIISVLHIAWQVQVLGYLPQPFFYVTTDTFMDWHNTAYWANNKGAYDAWHSVYPPISFVFLRIFSVGSCYASDPFVGRDCDWLGRATMFGFYALNAWLVFLVFRRVDRRTALVRATMMTIGLPMLWALERGNLIIPTFTFFVLAHGRILKSARMRWLAHAIAINFKPYLVLTVLPHAIRRRWRWLECCGMLTIAVYLVTFVLQGGGTLTEVAENAKLLGDSTRNNSWTDFFNATSYTPLHRFLISPFPVMYYAGSRLVEFLIVLLPILLKIGMLGILAVVGLAWFRPGATRDNRLIALIISFIMTASEPSGYTEVFLLFLLFLEKWQGFIRITILICCYLLCITADQVIFEFFAGYGESWITGRKIFQEYGIAVGQFIRPGLMMIIQYALIILCLTDIVRADRDGARQKEP